MRTSPFVRFLWGFIAAAFISSPVEKASSLFSHPVGIHLAAYTLHIPKAGWIIHSLLPINGVTDFGFLEWGRQSSEASEKESSAGGNSPSLSEGTWYSVGKIWWNWRFKTAGKRLAGHFYFLIYPRVKTFLPQFENCQIIWGFVPLLTQKYCSGSLYFLLAIFIL